jgi:hypothetical protein
MTNAQFHLCAGTILAKNLTGHTRSSWKQELVFVAPMHTVLSEDFFFFFAKRGYWH